MSADLLGVLQAINQESLKGMKPTDLCFGTVAQPEPDIRILLEGTMQPIPTAAIVLCDSVRARQVVCTDSNGDSVTVPLSTALTAGERVVMLRCAQGQRFVVLSRA